VAVLSRDAALRRFAAFTTASVAWKVAVVAAALVLLVRLGGGH